MNMITTLTNENTFALSLRRWTNRRLPLDYIQSMKLHIAVSANRTLRVSQIHSDIIPTKYVGMMPKIC